MSKISTVKRLLAEDKRQIIIAIYNNIVHTGLTNIIPDKVYLKLTHWIRFGEKLDFSNPVTFNQKLQWLKIYDRNSEYIKLVDKILVKNFVADNIGEEYIIPTLGVWNSSDEIDFDRLPNQFVLKCNHDSGSVIVCKDKSKLDVESAKRKLTKGIKTDAFFWGREWPYKGVERKIFAEKYMKDDDSDELKDYKFMCFNGKVKCSFVGSERYSEDGLKITFFDLDWNVMPFERHYHKSSIPIKKPKNYEKMIYLAEKLSKNIPFVRVDFYETGGKVYFGEMTFYPGSGWEEFKPYEWDKKLGSWIQLPER